MGTNDWTRTASYELKKEHLTDNAASHNQSFIQTRSNFAFISIAGGCGFDAVHFPSCTSTKVPKEKKKRVE